MDISKELAFLTGRGMDSKYKSVSTLGTTAMYTYTCEWVAWQISASPVSIASNLE